MESLRRMVRGALGYRSPIYRAGAVALNTFEVVRKEGKYMLSTIRRIEAAPPGPPESVKFNSLAHPIHVRPGTNDLVTVVDTVVRAEYGQHLPSRAPGVLVDAGAFIGDTSAWYLTNFPHLKSWSLEPNTDNFKLATANLAPYGSRATVLNAALAGRHGTVTFEGGGTAGSIGSGTTHVEAVTVPMLLEMIPAGRIDVLKMDIEGAELDVFQTNAAEWLPKVGLIIVELHGPEITRAVHEILSASGMDAKQYRSVWYCTHKGR